jgi:hypothetical protein
MLNISKFLNKFSKNIESNDDLKNKIIEIVKNTCQLELKEESIEIKENILIVNASPAIKNKLFIFKEKILEEISKTVSYKVINIK